MTDPTPIPRRAVLRMFGLAAGTAAVAGAGGLTWRAVDNGVFGTETGPAYTAWDATGSPGPLGLVRAAVLAANAHNTQPWRFRVTPNQIDLYADRSRNIGTIDPLLRELHISLGCALENLALAGPPNGLQPDVRLLPDPANADHIATITLTAAPAATSPLFTAITTRHTNRGPYDLGRPVSRQHLDTLAGLVDPAGAELVWLTSVEQKRAFGDLTIRATEAIIADPQQTADDHRWYRGDWDEIQRGKDGITIDPSGQPALIRTLGKLLPTSRAQNNNGWLRGTRETHVPTAAAFGALVVHDPDDAATRLRVGRAWQRIHLTATTLGLAMQPLCQIPERIDRERSANLSPDFTHAIAPTLPTGTHPIMTFRIGHPTTPAPRSPRRPAVEVVVT